MFQAITIKVESISFELLDDIRFLKLNFHFSMMKALPKLWDELAIVYLCSIIIKIAGFTWDLNLKFTILFKLKNLLNIEEKQLNKIKRIKNLIEKN